MKAVAQAKTVVQLREEGSRTPAFGANAIALTDVDKVFQGRQGEVHALDKINLSIRNKEFVCLLGPSGCGKSTILGMIAGLTRPTGGTVTIDGKSVDAARQKHLPGA